MRSFLVLGCLYHHLHNVECSRPYNDTRRKHSDIGKHVMPRTRVAIYENSNDYEYPGSNSFKNSKHRITDTNEDQDEDNDMSGQDTARFEQFLPGGLSNVANGLINSATSNPAIGNVLNQAHPAIRNVASGMLPQGLQSQLGGASTADAGAEMMSPEVLSLFRKLETPRSAPDVTKINSLQGDMEKKLAIAAEKGESLKRQIELLNKLVNVSARKGLEIDTSILSAKEIGEAEAQQHAEKIQMPQTEFTAPVILLLPDPPSPLEKLELLKAMACKKRANSPAALAAKNKRMKALAQVTGKNETELEAEIKETKARLETEKARRKKAQEDLTDIIKGGGPSSSIIYLKEDMKTADEAARILIHKLDTLARRKTALARQKMETES